MAIQINRIHVEIRKNLSSEVKDNIVSKKIEIEVDNKMKKPLVNDEKDKKNDKKKKFFTINGVKNNNKNIEIEAEFKKEEFAESSTGIFIDKVK